MAAKRPSRTKLPLVVTLALMLVVVVAAMVHLSRRSTAPPGSPARVSPPVAAPEKPDVVLSPQTRAIPGRTPSRRLWYRNDEAARVLAQGSWDRWEHPRPLAVEGGLWTLDVKSLNLAPGRYDYKFLPDGDWEPGDNRTLYVNEDGLLERPPELVRSATIEAPRRIEVSFKRVPENYAEATVRLHPAAEISRTEWDRGSQAPQRMGYAVAGDLVTFYLDEQFYGRALDPGDQVCVAGTFNGWRSDGGRDGTWQLSDEDDDGTWERTVTLSGLDRTPGESVHFKFVVNGAEWLTPPAGALNAASDDEGNRNLQLVTGLSRSTTLNIFTAQPLPLDRTHMLFLGVPGMRRAYHEITPGAVLDRLVSKRPLGAVADVAAAATTYRVFAPRASQVDLCFYPGSDGKDVAAEARVSLTRDDDGAWARTLPGLPFGRYYGFSADGPTGAGEGFNGKARIGDPYARAVAHADGHSILVDPDATNAWFTGWSDGDYRAPAWQDVVIYETHVRDLTIDPSSGVPPALRGTYEGILATAGRGTGLDHLKAMGVNMIELLPVAEFENGTNTHGWGYNTAFYFAPEASYGRAPLKGSQYFEFKRLVNELHRQGFGVILDVVYNHVGSPNVFMLLDRKYYFRQDHEFRFSNFSGCGNDVRTEAPMMRRLIIDNVLYWMKEHHVDGFRFDLAELIDMETLMAIRDAARAVNPNVLLISEPWSFRGDHKQQLKGTGWAAWNNEFREAVKRFARGEGDREAVRRAVRGSVDSWAANPMQSINYLESHDDRCLADELTTNPGHDGRQLSERDVARHRLAATVLFTSLGIPMLAEGQEYVRSKEGRHNTFADGDEINALRWGERSRPLAAAMMQYYRGLMAFRRSRRGRALRWAKPVPDDYIEWILPDGEKGLGYIINGDRKYPGWGIAVLLNAAESAAKFEMRLPPGNWCVVGNGRRIDPEAVERARLPGPIITVSPMSAHVLVTVEQDESRSWIAEAIIYQVNLRSLAAREPRNAFEAMAERPLKESPLVYVTRQLSDLERFGVNVLYLMPPYPIGREGRKGIGSPYSSRDFRAVDPEYGSLEDLRRLVQMAHAGGLKVILDITPNHTSRDHVWAKRHPDYHVRNGDGTLFYDWDWSDTAKLDYRNPRLRRAMRDVLHFWLGLLGTDGKGHTDGVDGFRLDMAHIINDLTFWNESLAWLRARHAPRELLFLAESYGTANNLDLFKRGVNAAYDDDLYKICCFLYALDADGNSIIHAAPEAEEHTDFSDKLAAFRQGGIAGAVERALMNYEEVLAPDPDGPRLARYTDNHDEGRGRYRFGEGAQRAMMQLAFLAGHTIPFLLTGQEFGALNRPSIHERIGFCDKGFRRLQDGGAQAVEGIEFEGNLFARSHEERRRCFDFYRELIRLRRRTPALCRGRFALLDVGEECPATERTVVAFDRRTPPVAVRCAVNLGPEPRALRNAEMLTGKPLYGTLTGGMLAPFSAVVVRGE